MYLELYKEFGRQTLLIMMMMAVVIIYRGQLPFLKDSLCARQNAHALQFNSKPPLHEPLLFVELLLCQLL